MRERFRFSPNIFIVSDARRNMLKPSLILRSFSLRMKEVISGVHDEAYVPLEIPASSAGRDHRGPVCAGMPSYT